MLGPMSRLITTTWDKCLAIKTYAWTSETIKVTVRDTQGAEDERQER